MYSLTKILVPLDGSDNSQRALGVAASLAKLSQGKIVCLYSVNIVPFAETQPLILYVANSKKKNMRSL